LPAFNASRLCQPPLRARAAIHCYEKLL
jgi:hypothetical protein